MARNRTIPADRHWFREYIRKHGWQLSPDAAVEQLDSEQWRRMQAAYRVHRAKGRAQTLPQLKPDSLRRLETIRRRIGAPDLDNAIERLYSVPDIGEVVRDALQRGRR